MVEVALRAGDTPTGRGLPDRPLRFQVTFNSGLTWHDLGFFITNANGFVRVPVLVPQSPGGNLYLWARFPGGPNYAATKTQVYIPYGPQVILQP
jgi:hypothetical protein